jgi:integrase
MPIVPSDYPDRDPVLSEEERKGIAFLLTLSSGQYRVFEQQVALLKRVTQPLLDVLALLEQWRPRKSQVRRQHFLKYFLRHVLQTNTLYWGWSRSLWETVIDAAPTHLPGKAHKEEAGHALACPNSLLAHLAAYLFADVLYLTGNRAFPARKMGEIIFGSDVLQTTLDRIMEPWLAAGFTDKQTSQVALMFAIVLALLVNHNPSPEALTPSILEEIQALELRRDVRWRVEQLQRALFSLQEQKEEHKQIVPPFRAESFAEIHPRWSAWLRAFWQQTPISQSSRNRITRDVLTACRWLAQRYPQVIEPCQWTSEIASQYVAYVCNEATVYDYASSRQRQYITKYLKKRQGEPLKPSSKKARLVGLKGFFRCLQKYSYEVDGRMEPRLPLSWKPDDIFAIPEAVRAQIQPNPRNIEEEAWLKLIWTACTLNAEMVKEAALGTKMYPLPLWRAVALVWVTGCRRRDEIRRLPLDCVRSEWAPEMVDERGVQLEPAENLWYLLVPTNKYRGTFWTPIPKYTADAILAWKAIRPQNQPPLEDRKTGERTAYLFQYRGRLIGETFINDSVIPLLCKAAGLTDEEGKGKPYKDAVGPITSHRARASTAYYLKAMGMSPYDIGKLLGHTNPNRTLPWYLKENLHQLGRMYRKANPLDRTVHALLDTNAAGKGEPCVFYYLADSQDGRPRLCGNPNFRTCYHQLQCAECEAYIETEMAEVIEQRPGILHIAVPIPLPEQLVEDLTKQEEGIPIGEPPPPPPIPSAAFHFNKKVAARIEQASDQTPSELDQLHTRLANLEKQLAAKGKQDARNVSIRLLKQEIGELKQRITELERQQKNGGHE